MPKVWTRKELRALAARRTAGESTEAIALSVGTSANNLRFRWRKHIGFCAQNIHRGALSVSDRTVRVWGWMRDGLTLSQCCEKLGWPSDQKHLNRLNMALRRYCKRVMIPLQNEVPHGQGRSRKAPEQAHPHAG